MNKAKLKSYAPQARLDFIAAITARANLLGLSEKAGHLEVAPAQTQGDVTLIAGQAWPAKVAAQREQLIARMRREGFGQTCEAVAYTWFNRFAALRYMELHDYLGHGHRALSSAEGGLPDILTYASDLAHAGDSGLPGLKAELVTEMKLAGNRDSELYRMLLVAQCNALSRTMPFLFERIDDDSELLLPDNLLRSDSVIEKLVEEISEEDWAEVEIIGWLYQFYISDKKDQVIGKVVKSEDIPAATQLFTPNWIVQYLVQNSVGRLWLMANPSSPLARQWPYYIAPAEQAPEVQAQLNALIQTRVHEDGDTLNPESINVLDPACGSGHILVVAYDVLKSIYLERGYQPRAIPRLILEKNLYGLDIDDRAAQMAGFALMMKARADDRRLFSDPVNLNILSLQESNGLDVKNLTQSLEAIVDSSDLRSDVGVIGSEFVAQDLFPESHLQSSLGESTPTSAKNKELKATITTLITTFAYAKTFGSLIKVPEQLSAKLLWLKDILNLAHHKGDLYAKSAAQDLIPLVAQAQYLSMKFDAVVANPPYMGNGGMNDELKKHAKDFFPDSKPDLFAMFMERGFDWCKRLGFNSMVTMQSWMFLSSYKRLRDKFLANRTLSNMVHMGNGVMGIAFGTAATVLINEHINEYDGSFSYCASGDINQNGLPKEFPVKNDRLKIAKPDLFTGIPGSPIVYWISKSLASVFEASKYIKDVTISDGQNKTGDNDKYLRHPWELSKNEIIEKRWIPYSKGGAWRKWYGNIDLVINWSDEARAHYKKDKIARLIPSYLWYRKGLTWSFVTTKDIGFRYLEEGGTFDVQGSSLFFEDESLIYPMLALLNSKPAITILKFLNPTISLQVENVRAIPIPNFVINVASDIAINAINLAKYDWDIYETSMDFSKPYFLSEQNQAETALKAWMSFKSECIKRVASLQILEEQSNTLFIEAYGLGAEFSPEVSESQITLARADREKDSQRLISYAIGCMMGRYSLDHPGLIYAHAGNKGFDADCYTSFPADGDGIIPITDELWFDEDASNRVREFLCAVWGPDTLEENMTWLTESLGAKPDETSDETIRRYIFDKFFKDHLQTYKKRPIYWLFSSGNQGAFQALVYLHRYNEGTLARMRAEYVMPLTSKIQSRIEMLEKDVNAVSSTAARNKLAKEVEKLKKKYVELLAYDEQLRHFADMRITLDLDDGVKVNYGKFGDLLAEVKAVTGGAGDE